MRLLDVNTLIFTEFLDETALPKYAIASHRWGHEEITFEDVQEGRNKSSVGYRKVEAFAQYVQKNVASVDWLWIDTCCINKKDAAELSYSINSMFRWYRNAELCIARLAAATQQSEIGQDEWFQRGWTLQELIAPRLVVFLTQDWQVIGNKGSSFHPRDNVGPDIAAQIATITGIPERILNDWGASVNMRVEDKMHWIDNRKTTREEDMSYALFGIVGVAPGANYGEGADNARNRVVAAIRQRDEVEGQRKARYQEITEWLRPSDPWVNHNSARRLHEEQTGGWLLQMNEYRAWRSGDGDKRYLWLYGGAGCGKTVLSSTAIEDMKVYCDGKGDIGHAVFYFSFSDERKQSYDDLLTSLVAQLGHRDPAFSMLQQMHNNRRPPGQEELEKVLHAALASYERVFCHLDALDECPEENGARQRMLDSVERLLRQAPNMYLIATSRDELGIRYAMEQLGVMSICLTSKKVNPDIQRYVSKQLTRIPKLSRLDTATKELVQKTLTEKADGM
jgi:hypothetical protein